MGDHPKKTPERTFTDVHKDLHSLADLTRAMSNLLENGLVLVGFDREKDQLRDSVCNGLKYYLHL